jgi:uncharacterized membrane protein (DUF441 family)
MAYRMGARKESNLAGKIIMAVGIPISWAMGAMGFKPVEKSSLLRGYAVWGITTVLLVTSVVAQGVDYVVKKIARLFK